MTREDGFTLIEILIAVFVSFIIAAILGASFISGNRIRQSNDDLNEIQQNIRVSMQLMAMELRMAGYELSPNWSSTATRSTNQISGDTSSITFYYVADDESVDSDGDGAADSGSIVQVTYALNGNDLERTSNTATYNRVTKTYSTLGTDVTYTIASDIDALYFQYYQGNDSSGAWNDTPASKSDPEDSDPIITQAVQINLVARSSHENVRATAVKRDFYEPQANTLVYTNPTADRYSRRLASTVVSLRNMQ